MRVAIMQPYLLPYLGYFQLIEAVDQFVIYDTVKYTKKGWINRNRFLRDGEPVVFTLPIERGSDLLDICNRRVATSFAADQLCRQVAQAYRRAPHFDETMPLVEAVLRCRADDLFGHLHHALVRTCAHLGIGTPIRVASEIEDETVLRRQDRVLDICLRLGATRYINPIGGMELYHPAAFARHGIALRFLRPRPVAYAQFAHPFVPWLSIVDVMMFNSRPTLLTMLREGYDLIEGEDAACPSGASSGGSSILERSATGPG
ncbi:WbqC family protein [Methylobacterium planeticum]|uniref:WbqC family protein n=1 Tax=Methylobacterium planeticum TaxID=2615211 RepID=A0A6N6MYE6_9HYPH|nr:WbqC family protein [Methylobacterium planeticum]KAB1076073.1 WbqC family protein [Methylobacterium planeticum]